MKTLIKLLACAIIVVFFTASCKEKITDGIVIKKEIQQGGSYLMPMPAGKITILMPMYYPAEYRLIVQNGDKTQKFCVEKETFERVSCGDSVRFSK